MGLAGPHPQLPTPPGENAQFFAPIDSNTMPASKVEAPVSGVISARRLVGLARGTDRESAEGDALVRRSSAVRSRPCPRLLHRLMHLHHRDLTLETEVAIAQVDNRVALWSVQDPAKPVQVGVIGGLGSTPTSCDMAPLTERIAIGESSGRVSVWDISDPSHPTEQRSWTDASSDIYSMEFSRDEHQLIGTSGDDVGWGWRLDSPDTHADFALNGEIGRPWDVRFLADGNHFAGSGDIGAVRIWDSSPELARQSLCSRIGDMLTADEWRRYLPGIQPRRVC